MTAQIKLVSKSREFSEIQLRMNEKRTLNTLNRDKNRITIRSDLGHLQIYSSTITTELTLCLDKHNGRKRHIML